MNFKFNQKNQELVPASPADKRLKGLAKMLNPDTIKNKLASHFRDSGAEIGGCMVSYIRYKPNTNCIIAYKIKLSKNIFAGDSELPLYAKVFTAENFPDGVSKARSHRWTSFESIDPILIMPEHNSIIYLFPNDAVIDGARILSNPKKIKRILYRHYDKFPKPEWRISDSKLKMTVVRYKPERRIVLRCDSRAKNRASDKIEPINLYIRIYADDLVESVYNIQKSLYQLSLSQKELIIAKPVCYLHDRKLFIMESIGEKSLIGEMESGNMAALRLAAEALSLLHLNGPMDLPRRNIDSFIREAKSTVGMLISISPDTQTVVESIYNDLNRLLPISSGDSSGFVHGDFHPGQVIMQGGSAGIIDFDRSHCGDVIADIGNFLAHLKLFRSDRTFSGRSDIELDFLKAYEKKSGKRVESKLLTFWTAFGLFQLAVGPFRRLESDWREKTNAILKECRSILS